MAVKRSQALNQTLHFRASYFRSTLQSRLSVCEHRSDEGVHAETAYAIPIPKTSNLLSKTVRFVLRCYVASRPSTYLATSFEAARHIADQVTA
jgi:hypothetical protein